MRVSAKPAHRDERATWMFASKSAAPRSTSTTWLFVEITSWSGAQNEPFRSMFVSTMARRPMSFDSCRTAPVHTSPEYSADALMKSAYTW